MEAPPVFPVDAVTLGDGLALVLIAVEAGVVMTRRVPPAPAVTESWG